MDRISVAQSSSEANTVSTTSSASHSLLRRRRSLRISSAFSSADAAIVADGNRGRRKVDGKRGSGKSSAAEQSSSSTSSTIISMPPLLNLGRLVRGTVLKRPSSQIKSPYVADVTLLQSNDAKKKKKKSAEDTAVLAHAPALDVGGLCVPGSEVYMSERPSGGKTSHAIELVRSNAPISALQVTAFDPSSIDKGVLVGAHPRLGELIAEEVLKRGLLKDVLPLKNGFELGPVNDFSNDKKKKTKATADASSKKRKATTATNNDSETTSDTGSRQDLQINMRQQVTLGDSRVDFEMTLTAPKSNASHRVIFEVKNVVCADYEAGTEPVKSGANHCVVVAQTTVSDGNNKEQYQRTALFPWAKTRSQMFEGQKVCSARALKHLKNLEHLLSKCDVTPVVLFVVNRSDCESIRACHEACPVFKEVLEEVVKKGVKALGVRVRWIGGECFFDGIVPVIV